MADRFPIILNTSANQLQEMPAGDTLDISDAAIKTNLVDSKSVVGTGVSIVGVVTATSFVGSGANLTNIDVTAVKDSGGNVKIQAQDSGAIYTGIHTFGSTTSFTNGVFNGTVTSTGAVVNGDSDLNGDLDVDGHTNLDNVSVAGVTTATGTLNSTGGIILTANMSVASDTAKVFFGASNDLSIYHNGSHSYIDDTGTGNLKVRSNNFRVSNADESKLSATFVPSGAVELYHNNTKRFETTNTGVNLTNHSYSIISGAMGSTENIKISNTTSGGYIQIGMQQQDSDGLHHRGYIKASKGSASIAGKLELLARGSGGGTNRGWIIDAAVGIQANQQVLPESDNTYDLGSSTKRWNDLYLSGGLRVGGTGTSNELDDYEEGSFSPTLKNGNNGYRFQQGSYLSLIHI